MQLFIRKNWKRSEAIEAILVLSKLIEGGSEASPDVKEAANKKIKELIEKELIN